MVHHVGCGREKYYFHGSLRGKAGSRATGGNSGRHQQIGKDRTAVDTLLEPPSPHTHTLLLQIWFVSVFGSVRCFFVSPLFLKFR